jgi:hypothetical protein
MDGNATGHQGLVEATATDEFPWRSTVALLALILSIEAAAVPQRVKAPRDARSPTVRGSALLGQLAQPAQQMIALCCASTIGVDLFTDFVWGLDQLADGAATGFGRACENGQTQNSW